MYKIVSAPENNPAAQWETYLATLKTLLRSEDAYEQIAKLTDYFVAWKVRDPSLWHGLIGLFEKITSPDDCYDAFQKVTEGLHKSEVAEPSVYQTLVNALKTIQDEATLSNCMATVFSQLKNANVQDRTVWQDMVQLSGRLNGLRFTYTIERLCSGLSTNNIEDNDLWNDVFRLVTSIPDADNLLLAIKAYTSGRRQRAAEDGELWKTFLQKTMEMKDVRLMSVVMTHLADMLISQLKWAPTDTMVVLYSYLKQFPEYEAGFTLFKETVLKINGEAPENQKLDGLYLIATHQVQIRQLMEIMGKDAFQFLSQPLARSVQPLKRYLDHLSVFDQETLVSLNRFYKQQPAVSKAERTEVFKQWGELFHLYDRFVQMESPDEFNKVIKEAIAEKTPLKDVVKRLQENAVQLFLEKLDIANDELRKKVSERVPTESFADFLSGRRFLLNHAPDKLRIYEGMLSSAFHSHEHYLNFMLSTKENSMLGTQLATYNQQLLEVIKKTVTRHEAFCLGKFPPETIRFSSTKIKTGVSQADLQQTQTAIITQLNTLYRLLETNSSKPVSKKLADFIKKQAGPLLGTEPPTQKALKSYFNSDDSLKKLAQHCSSFMQPLQAETPNAQANALKEESGATLYQEFCEHITHLQEYLTHYNEQKKASAAKPGKGSEWMNRDLTIRVWQRDPVADLAKGSQVNCCLSPNGTQFQAMIERLMDAGMGVVEIVEPDTQQAIALNWLFLAWDKTTQKPYLVANFHEMSNRVVDIPELRTFLINELTRYTSALAKHMGIGYLIRPLKYGLIPDFKGLPEAMDLTLEKLGGFFKFGRETTDESIDSYYLQSLKESRFYSVDTAKGSSNAPPPPVSE